MPKTLGSIAVLSRRPTAAARSAAGAGVTPGSSQTGRSNEMTRLTGVAGTSAMAELSSTAGINLTAGGIMTRSYSETGGSSRTVLPAGITGTCQTARLAESSGRKAILAPPGERRPTVTSAASPHHGRATSRPRERPDWLPMDMASARRAS
ncbi:MAG TPA: hypothetical protein VF940_14525 [Streptosporangiaceae bacterium]